MYRNSKGQFLKGHPDLVSKESRLKHGEKMRGRSFSSEHKQKISRAHKGKHMSPNTEFKTGHVGFKAMLGKRLPDETIEKIRQKNLGRTPWNKGKPHPQVRGEKNHFWKGGITPVSAQIRESLEYKRWRRAVLARDHFTCVFCGARNGNGHAVKIHADHIKPFAYFPDLRFEVSNGRTLCVDCHKKTDSYLNRWYVAE